MSESRSFKFCYSFLFLAIIVATCEAQFKPIPKNCPPYEFWTACGASCQTECATLGQPCLIMHFRCPDGCYCNKGYARDARGKCIPIASCPKY